MLQTNSWIDYLYEKARDPEQGKGGECQLGKEEKPEGHARPQVENHPKLPWVPEVGKSSHHGSSPI